MVSTHVARRNITDRNRHSPISGTESASSKIPKKKLRDRGHVELAGFCPSLSLRVLLRFRSNIRGTINDLCVPPAMAAAAGKKTDNDDQEEPDILRPGGHSCVSHQPTSSISSRTINFPPGAQPATRKNKLCCGGRRGLLSSLGGGRTWLFH